MSVLAYRVGRCLLQEKIDALDMSQVDLAKRLKVTKQQINKYATNEQKMSIRTAKNISSILNCTIEDLYEWIEVGNKE